MTCLAVKTATNERGQTVQRQLAMFLAIVVVGLPFAVRAEVLFQDNFDDGNADGWEEIDATFAVVNGEYEIDSTTPFVDGRAVAMTGDFTDFVLEADYRELPPGPGRTSFLFRVVDIAPGFDAGHYYQFHVDSGVFAEQVQFCRMANSGGNCDILATAPFPNDPGITYAVRLEVIGDSATAFIDGNEVLSVSGLTEYPSGRIGLKSIFWISRFDNVVVSEPVIPPFGDFDGDGDIDLADFAFLSVCFRGAFQPIPAFPVGCEACDFDGDGDIDLADFSEFSRNFTGPI